MAGKFEKKKNIFKIKENKKMQSIQNIMKEAVKEYNADPDTHAEYPPSSAKRWCNCPGSVALSVGCDDGPNKYTAEGSLAHLLCALLITLKIKTQDEAEELVGDLHTLDGFEIEITEEMVEGCLLYAQTIFKDAKEHGIKSNKAFLNLAVSEQKVQITSECSGTSDCYLGIPFKKLYVYDFKYGAGVPVDVKDNYQMKSYGVGALAEFEKGGSSYMEDIELVIIQPRARHKDGSVRRWNTTRARIIKFKKELEEKIALCKTDDALIKSGDWCVWCPGKHKCPGLFDDAQAIAKKAFDVIDTGQGTLVAMSDEQMIEILDKADTITGFIKSVRAHAQSRIEGGNAVGDYKLVRGRATRSWIDQDKVEAAFSEVLSEDDMFTKKFVSPAQMEKVLKANPKCKKVLGIKTVKDAKAEIESFVDPGEGKLTLAPGHDKREQVLLTTGEYFDEL